jgi:hypothetical protein
MLLGRVGMAVEPVDETEGTPEWAKRMFCRLRSARWRFVTFMFFVVLPAFGAYSLVQAAIRGEVWYERSDRWISYSAELGKLIAEIAVWVVALVTPILFVLMRRLYPDRVQRFQGNIKSRYISDPASRREHR